jgi:hypothetical protein
MYPHRIRLRGPWDCEPLAWLNEDSSEPLPAPRRVTMPCGRGEAGIPGFDGRLRFRRRFGYPGRIDAQERVWLIFEGIAGQAEIRLNDQVLGRRSTSEPKEAFEFDVTSLLQARNELIVDVVATEGQGGLWGEVALEVRCTAFLTDLRRIAISKTDGVELHVTGRVVGTAERPLELYVILDRFVSAYQVISATPEGQPFEIVVPNVAAASVVKVDLVNGATVWYTSEAEWTLVPMSDPVR